MFLYCLLNDDSYYLINEDILVFMLKGVMFINILCGGFIDDIVVIGVLKK